MITKIVPNYLNLFKLMVTPNLFFCTQTTFRRQRKLVKDITRVENCQYFQQLNSYLSQNLQQLQDQPKDILKVASKLILYSKPFERVNGLTKYLDKIDYQNCTIQDLAAVCHLVYFLSHNCVIHYTVLQKLSTRITQLLNEPEKISDEQILNFLQLAHDRQRGELTQKLNLQLSERIPNLKIRQYNKYLQLTSRKKFPSRLQKQNFQKFFPLYQQNLDKLQFKYLFNGYKSLKSMNKKIYPALKNTVRQIQQKIKNNLQQLDEKQISIILNYKSQLNPFNQIFYEKIIESIDDNGQPTISQQLIFKIFDRLQHNTTYWLSNQNQAKFVKFLQKNLENHRLIIKIIKKDIISRPYLQKLVISISQSLYVDRYQADHSYVYHIISQNLSKKDQFIKYISDINLQTTFASLSQHFIHNALIVQKLYSKNKEDVKLQQIYKKFQKLIKENINERFFNTDKFRIDYQLLRKFNKKYNIINIYINNLPAEYKLSNPVLGYFMISNKHKQLIKLIKANPKVGNDNQIKLLLERVINQPSQFAGCLEFINKVLSYKVDNNPNMQIINRIWVYLCSWEVHAALNPDQIISFLQLLRDFMKNTKSIVRLDDFLSYMSKTPQKWLKIHPYYKDFLQQSQQLYLGLKKGYLNPSLCIELIKTNAMSRNFAQQIFKEDRLTGFIRNYAQIVFNNKQNSSQLQATNYQNTLLILRNKNTTQQHLKQQKASMLTLFSQSSIRQLQQYLVNIQLKNNATTFQILSNLITTYTNRLRNRPDYRFIEILENLQGYFLHTTQYKALLKKITQIYSRKIYEIPVQFLIDVFEFCLAARLQSKEFVGRLINWLNIKLNRHELNTSSLNHIMDGLLISDPLQGFKFYINVLRMSNGEYKYKLLNSLISCNFQDPNFKQQISAILSQKETKISQPVFRYLVSKIPQLQSLSQNLELQKAYEPKWLFEIITNFAKQKGIQFQTQQKYGHCVIIIDNRYICFVANKKQNRLNIPTLRNYFSFVFDIPAQSLQKTYILFTNNKYCKNTITRLLTLEIPQLTPYKNQFTNAVFKNKQDSDNQNKNIDNLAAQVVQSNVDDKKQAP